MIAFRKSHPSIGRPVFWREDVAWYGPDGPVDLGARIAVPSPSCCAAPRSVTGIST